MARKKYRKRRTSSVREYSYDPYYSQSTSSYRRTRSRSKSKKKKKRIHYKTVLLITMILVGLFVFFNFSLIYQEFLYLTLNKGINDGKVVLFGDSDFSIFEDPDPSNPPIVAKNNEYSIIIPKIGMNASLISDIDVNDETEIRNIERNPIVTNDSGVPGEDKKIKILGHFPVKDIDNIKDSNTPFLITYKLRNNDYIYIVYENYIYKYKVVSSNYELAQIEDTLEEIDRINRDNLFIISYGPLFDNVWSYVVEAELMDK